MCEFLLFLSVDPSLGRLDYHLLSDQALIEMFIDGFDAETKKDYQYDHCMYLDVCEWPAVHLDLDNNQLNLTHPTSDLGLEMKYAME